jgi:phosphate-selective porin
VPADIDSAEIMADEDNLALEASYETSGFRLESRDGNWRTDLQWRAQLRASTPLEANPRQLSAFAAEDVTNFSARRLRMKIGGHGYQPWLRYYFEVDLQPTRNVDSSSASASTRVITWRADIAKWAWGGIRVGQWKADLNRERVDSSGRQQFVERSISNRVFTMDRQIGIQLRGRAFRETPADISYWAGVFNGEGRGVRNNGNGMMYMGRVQWNFLGRAPAWRQTDVEYTELPTGSFALAGLTNTGSCTRWSSSGCGNLDGFESPSTAASDQFEIDQVVQEFAFKYRGLSIQQEYHEKTIQDRSDGSNHELTGGYVQAGYFFHHLFPSIPAPLEFAMRFALVNEPNAVDRAFENQRREYTLGANWFFSGHNNKITVDLSQLTLDDGRVGLDDSENRLRLQWDVSF